MKDFLSMKIGFELQELTNLLIEKDEQNGKETLYFNIQGDGLCARN